jgi:hypothetical protein
VWWCEVFCHLRFVAVSLPHDQRQRMGANRYRQARKWLRGVDLNHRPLGYECG